MGCKSLPPSAHKLTCAGSPPTISGTRIGRRQDRRVTTRSISVHPSQAKKDQHKTDRETPNEAQQKVQTFVLLFFLAQL